MEQVNEYWTVTWVTPQGDPKTEQVTDKWDAQRLTAVLVGVDGCDASLITVTHSQVFSIPQ